MIAYLKDLWARLTVHWHVLLAALIASLPSILDWLGYVDLKPILVHLGAREDVAAFIVNMLPFVLAFLRPLIVVAPPEHD